MTIRARKTKKFGMIKLTASKRGLGVSVGVPGARIGLGSDGKVRRTVGIPGSGIYDTKVIGNARRGTVETPASAETATPTSVTVDEDGMVSVAMDPNRMPTVSELRQMHEAGLSHRQTSLVLAQWWAARDESRPASPWYCTPFHSNSRGNRSLRARRLAKLESKIDN